MDRLRSIFTLVDIPHPQRWRAVRTEDSIAAVEQSNEKDPNESIRYRAQKIWNCAHLIYGRICGQHKNPLKH